MTRRFKGDANLTPTGQEDTRYDYVLALADEVESGT